MNEPESILPEKLSDCVELAANEIERLNGDPRITWDPYEWGAFSFSDEARRCDMCVAGAALYQRASDEDERYFLDLERSARDDRTIDALDEIRREVPNYLMRAPRCQLWAEEREEDDDIALMQNIPRLLAYLRDVVADLREIHQ